MVRAINIHSVLYCLNHRAPVVDNSGHVNNLSCGSSSNGGISTVFSTTCTRNRRNSSKSLHLHLWNLHEMHKQYVGHLTNELQQENLYVLLNSQDQRNLPKRNDGEIDDH